MLEPLIDASTELNEAFPALAQRVFIHAFDGRAKNCWCGDMEVAAGGKLIDEGDQSIDHWGKLL